MRRVCAGILTVLLCAAVFTGCTGLFPFFPQGGENSEASNDVSAAEESSGESESAGEFPEDIPLVTMPPESGDSSDAPEEEQAGSAEDTAMYSSYLDDLAAHKDRILGYDWQITDLDGDRRFDRETGSNKKPVALCDVTGSGTPELLYFYADPDGDGSTWKANLRVLTYEDEELRVLYDELLDAQVAGGIYYALFTTKEGALWVMTDYGDEDWCTQYDLFDREGNGIYRETKLLRKSFAEFDGEKGEYTGERQEYEVDGAEASLEEYGAEVLKLYASIGDILLYSGPNEEGLLTLIGEKGTLSMSYEEAEKKLIDRGAVPGEGAAAPGGTGSSSSGGSPESDAAPSGIPGDYYFPSGVGGWSTEMHINEDGSMYGYFHDSDMGSTGDDYPYGTVYLCSFTGRFSDFMEVDEKTRSMVLKELSVETPEGTEWIENGVRYVATYPYGVSSDCEAGDRGFMIYLKGSKVSDLPEEYVEWVRMATLWDPSNEPEVPFTGIYNVAEETGFFSAAG